MSCFVIFFSVAELLAHIAVIDTWLSGRSHNITVKHRFLINNKSVWTGSPCSASVCLGCLTALGTQPENKVQQVWAVLGCVKCLVSVSDRFMTRMLLFPQQMLWCECETSYIKSVTCHVLYINVSAFRSQWLPGDVPALWHRLHPTHSSAHSEQEDPGPAPHHARGRSLRPQGTLRLCYLRVHLKIIILMRISQPVVSYFRCGWWFLLTSLWRTFSCTTGITVMTRATSWWTI